MIERLQAIATFLSRFTPFISLLALFFVGVFLTSLFEVGGMTTDDQLIPAIVGFCWSATLLSFANLFISAPVKLERKASLRVRLSFKVRRGLLWGLGLLMISLTFALMLMTFRLLRVWLGF